MAQISFSNIIKHVIIWGLITSFLCIVDPVPGPFKVQFFGTSLIMLGYICTYYIQYLFVLPRFFETKKLQLAAIVLFGFAVYVVIQYFNFFQVMIWFGDFPEFEEDTLLELLPSFILLFTIISFLALGNYQNKRSLITMKAQSEKEVALLSGELDFFKNQFNSHITFNFLNYCYGHIQETSPDDAEVIELYSDLLRATIHSKPDEPVALAKEIEYINQYIKLKKRFDQDICIEFSSETNEFTDFQILPRILVTFVENAIKHGETHMAASPIVIYLQATVNHLVVDVRNKKNKSKLKPISTGIGLRNVKEQLTLFYKNKYELIINEDPETYQCRLILTT